MVRNKSPRRNTKRRLYCIVKFDLQSPEFKVRLITMLPKQFVILIAVFVSFGQCFRTKGSLRKKNEKSDGRGYIRRICPSKVKLNCANVMYSKPCSQNYDCSYAGSQLVCCETGCPGDSKYVCVPAENSRCPYLQPITYTGLRKCRVERDCEQDFTCCLNIAGEGYCHKPTEDELNI